MTSRSLFTALTKLLGLWLFLKGMQNVVLCTYSYAFLDYGYPTETGWYLAHATPQILSGVLLVAKTDWIGRLCRLPEPDVERAEPESSHR